MQIAIVGAGMAGLSCATRLAALGHDVALFDKGRGPGGRMATRRVEADGTMLRFDHGAQYFTARDPRFVEQVARWEREGVVARWDAAGADAWVGTPAMNAPIKAMAGRHDVQFGTRIEQLLRDGDGWQLDGEGAPDRRFDAVVVALPAEQAGPLLQQHASAMGDLADATRSAPCWTIMAAFGAGLDPPSRRDRLGGTQQCQARSRVRRVLGSPGLARLVARASRRRSNSGRDSFARSAG